MKKTTAEMIEVMQAYAQGKEIQYKPLNQDEWILYIHGEPEWNWFEYDYRVNPKEKEKYKTHSSFLRLVKTPEEDDLVMYEITYFVYLYSNERLHDWPDYIEIEVEE